MAHALLDMIHEGRKLGLALALAHQYLDQLKACDTHLPSIVGSSIMFHIGGRDARCLHGDLQGKVDADDLVALKSGHAIGRIGDDVIRFRALPPLTIPRDDCRQLIVQQSHERYCRPVR